MSPQQRQIWLEQALALIPQQPDAPEEVRYRDQARAYLEPLMKRCRANSRPRWWQWLRIILAKDDEYVPLLDCMRESRVPPEPETPKPVVEGFKPPEINGDVALILVETGDKHAIWRVPLDRLPWALEQYPVFLKELPPVEHPREEELRAMKRKLEKDRPFMIPAAVNALIKGIEEAELENARAYDPIPRYCLMKSVGGKDIPVHRLFMDVIGYDAGDETTIVPIDGDFLNFAGTKVRFTAEPITTDGHAMAKGDRPPTTYSQELWMPNLQLVPYGSDEAGKKKFQKSILQVKLNAHGDIAERLPIQPNVNEGSKAGCFGRAVNIGKSEPITAGERMVYGGSDPSTPLPKGKKADKPTVRGLRQAWKLPA